MKVTTCALILALAVPAAAATDQGKAKGKAKPTPTAEQPAGTQAPAGGAPCAPDKTPPVISAVTASPSTLGPPNHKMTPVAISVKLSDNCTATTWAVTSVTSNEAVNGTGDGDTEPDWTIAEHAVTLRAERAGTGSGRTYTVTVTAKDAAGNASTGTTTVSVPHNR